MGAREKTRNFVKNRLDDLAQKVQEKVEWLARDVRGALNNTQLLAAALDEVDITLTALTAITAKRLGVTFEELEVERARVREVKEAHLRAAEEAPQPLPPEQAEVEQTVRRLQDGEAPDYPPEALIWGGQ